MSKMEKKFGRYAISNLSLILILCYVAGYIIEYMTPMIMGYLTLNPYAILHGQVWRLITWVIIPPQQNGIFWTVVALYFYYTLGTELERTWGVWKYNIYIFSGILFTILGSFLFMGYCYLFHSAEIGLVAAGFFGSASYYFSTFYINMSIFLGFAATYPETKVYLMFILPIKVKWLGIAYGLMLLGQFIQGGNSWASDAIIRFSIGCSLLNFVVFFIATRSHMGLSTKQAKQRVHFKSQVRRTVPISRHKCTVCGRTEEDFPDLEFRFCSKCEGNYEYCQDHLFTHEHIRKH